MAFFIDDLVQLLTAAGMRSARVTANAFAGIVPSPAIGAVLVSASTIVVAVNSQLLRKVNLNPAQLTAVTDRACVCSAH